MRFLFSAIFIASGCFSSATKKHPRTVEATPDAAPAEMQCQDTTGIHHCGSCAVDCALLLPGADAISCLIGVCTLVSCLPTRGDCNRDPSDGCEADLTLPEHCGSCDTACAPSPGDCDASGTVPICRCPSGQIMTGGLCVTNPVAVAVGDASACAIVGSGVKCWGSNTQGRLGDGTTTDSPLLPVSVAGLTGVTAVGVGFAHACALTQTGAVWCWGYNISGQLGSGNRDASSVPVNTIASGIVALGVGENHNCAVDSSGRVWCWGGNDWWQLGISAPDSDLPKAVPGLSGAVAVTAGGLHTCIVDQYGGAQCWGANQWGQLGLGAGANALILTPQSVHGLSNVSQLSAGRDSTCATTISGNVLCWGRNLADFSDKLLWDPTFPYLDVMKGTVAVTVSSGAQSNCVIATGGALLCWGWDSYYGLDQMPNLGAPVISVSCSRGPSQSCAVLSNGQVWCWKFGVAPMQVMF